MQWETIFEDRLRVHARAQALTAVEATETQRIDAADPEPLMAVLSKYVVLTRMQPGCRNVDLCASVTQPGRYLIVQKWDSAADNSADLPQDLDPAFGLHGISPGARAGTKSR